MARHLQELESMFVQSSPVGVPNPVPPAPADHCSTTIAGTIFADKVGDPKSDNGTDCDENSSDPDNQIIPPPPTKNPPIKSVPSDPSKSCLHASKDNAGGRHALDEDY